MPAVPVIAVARLASLDLVAAIPATLGRLAVIRATLALVPARVPTPDMAAEPAWPDVASPDAVIVPADVTVALGRATFWAGVTVTDPVALQVAAALPIWVPDAF